VVNRPCRNAHGVPGVEREKAWYCPSGMSFVVRVRGVKRVFRVPKMVEGRGLPPDGPQKTNNMNSERYACFVAAHFASWRAQCFGDERRAVLVQDHEQCLWTEEAQAAIHKAGFDLLTTRPKYSPDLNAIEGQWGRLRARLEKTAPTEVESRSCFIKRLRIAAARLNTHGLAGGQRLCVNQEVRAAEILELKGAKCKW
jgi:hypothetical protein